MSPFLMKDSDLLSCVNMYTRQYGAKKTRFGYQVLLDNPDNSQVQALNFSEYGSNRYLMRVSGSKVYSYPFSGGTTWGSSTLSLDSSPTTIPQFTQLSGQGIPVGSPVESTNYTHMVDGATGYLCTTDGINFTTFPFLTPLAANPPSLLTAWQGRAFANSDTTRFAFSSSQFDLYVNPNYSDPGQVNRPWNIPLVDANNDPGAWGVPDQQNAGFYGNMIMLTDGINRVNAYYQNGIVKWNGQTTIEMPFNDAIVPNMITTGQRTQLDYFVSYGRIYSNDGTSINEVSFGVRKILEDTFFNNGVGPNAFAFSWSSYVFFYFGNMTVDGKLLTNAMLVYNEDFNEWYVWSLAHNMSCMSTYTDVNGNVVLISGDVNGNTYVWDKSYTTDAGQPISYYMRTKFFDFGSPDKSKTTAGVGDKSSVSMLLGQNSKFSAAADYLPNYQPQTATSGFLSKFILDTPSKSFKTISFEISGNNNASPSEFLGATIKYLDQETRPGAKA